MASPSHLNNSVDKPRPIQLMFLTRSLNYGGAERQLVALATRFQGKGESVAVVTLYMPGPWQQDLEAAGVTIYNLGKRGRWDFLFLISLLRLVRQLKPAIIYSFMGIANILNVLCKLALPSVHVVWGVRASNMDLTRYGWVDQFLYRLEGALSSFPDLIISNSAAGLRYALAHGFPPRKMVVISNGIDTMQFAPAPCLRTKVRKELAILENDYLIGLVGRLDPMKDHSTFLRAAALLAQERHDARFLCVGDGPASYKSQLWRLSEQLGVAKRVIWLAAGEDMIAIYNALDVVTSSSSYGEAFSNAIAEAMSCGVPCVVTDVGDSKRIVGDTGEVVPPGDPRALVEAWKRMLKRVEDAPSVGSRARSRIAEHFDVDALIEKTSVALKDVSNHGGELATCPKGGV